MNLTLLNPEAFLYHTLKILKKNDIVLDGKDITDLYKEYIQGFFNFFITYAENMPTYNDEDDNANIEKENCEQFKGFFQPQLKTNTEEKNEN